MTSLDISLRKRVTNLLFPRYSPLLDRMNWSARSSSGQSAYSDLRSRLLLPSIPALDGIRAIAVFLVIFYHLSFDTKLPAVPGRLGVLSFFVLSGFLITWLLIKEQERSGSISLRRFYRRRALRIFPAFYVFWFLTVGIRLVVSGATQMPWSQALSAFFYVSNYLQAIYHPSPDFMIHTWSLSAEEQFYLAWPLTFLLFSRNSRRLMIFLAFVIAAIWVHRTHLWFTAHAVHYINFAFDTRADALLVGCFLALLLKEGLAQGLIEKICRPVWSPLVTAILIGCSVYAGGLSEAYKLTGGLAIEALLVAALICQLVLQSKAWPWKWLNSKPAVYLGRISYPLYLYHLLAAHATTFISTRIPGLSTPTFCAVEILVVIVMAACSYRFVEQPFLALKAKPATGSRPAAIPIVATAPRP